jgi:hypothetical protein
VVSWTVRLLGFGIFTRDVALVTWSFLFSWVYLRFAAHNPDGTVGDITEDFAFASLFPRVGGSLSAEENRGWRGSCGLKQGLLPGADAPWQVVHPYLAPLFNFS